jgi:hypothetical protein
VMEIGREELRVFRTSKPKTPPASAQTWPPGKEVQVAYHIGFRRVGVTCCSVMIYSDEKFYL